MKRIDIQEYKKIVLNVMIKIDKICRDNNLTYQLAFGTLLGCIRHGGFIPWDDDIDIIMPRDDYDKLRTIISNGEYGINFISIETCDKTIYPFGKVCDTSTRMIEKNFKNVPGYGAFVDVFPLDYLPEDDVEYDKYRKKARTKLKLITHSSRTSFEKSESLRRDFLKFVAYVGSRLFSTQKQIVALEKMVKSHKKTSYLGLPCSSSRFRISSEKIYNTKDGIFEGHSFLIPKDTDYFLTLAFGDYMQLPPKEKQVSNHQLNCYYIDESKVSEIDG